MLWFYQTGIERHYVIKVNITLIIPHYIYVSFIFADFLIFSFQRRYQNRKQERIEL